MRVTQLFALAARNVRRNVRRSLFTIVTLVIGLAAVDLFQGYRADTLASLTDAAVYGEMLGHLTVMPKGALERRQIEPERYSFDGAQLAKLGQVLDNTPSVEFSAARLLLSGLVTNGRASIVFFGLGIDPARYRRFTERFHFRGEGEPLSPDRPNAGMLAERMAKVLQVTPGQGVTLFSTTIEGRMNALDMNVSSVFDTGSAATNDKFLIAPLGLARRLYRTEGASEVAVVIGDPSRAAEVGDRIVAAARSRGLDVEVHDWREMSAFFRGVDQLYGMIFGFIFLIVITVALMSVVNTMTTVVLERVREIGVLRALGMRRGTVQRLFGAEGFLLGLLGAVGGTILAPIVAALVNGAHITYAPPGLSGEVPLAIAIDWGAMAANGLAVALLAGLISFVPAWRAARLEVVAALRHV